MGTESVWVPMLMAAAAGGVSEYNTRKTSRKQDEELAAGIRKNSKTQDEINSNVDKNLNFIEESRAQPFKDKLESEFMDAIMRSRANGLNGIGSGGATSDAFKQSAVNARTGAIDYGGLVSNLLAGVDAPGRQRQSEGFGSGNLGMDLSKLGRDANQDDFLARMRAGRIRPNAGLSILSSAFRGGGSAYGANANNVPGVP